MAMTPKIYDVEVILFSGERVKFPVEGLAAAAILRCFLKRSIEADKSQAGTPADNQVKVVL